MENGALTGVNDEENVVPESEFKRAMARIREIERNLGKSTMKVETLEVSRSNIKEITNAKPT
jgi:transposase